MINWVSLAFNTLWIIGCSILLAQFSYRQWLKQSEGNDISPRNRLLINGFAWLLIGIGTAVVNDVWWQRLLWIVTSASIIANEYLIYRSHEKMS